MERSNRSRIPCLFLLPAVLFALLGCREQAADVPCAGEPPSYAADGGVPQALQTSHRYVFSAELSRNVQDRDGDGASPPSDCDDQDDTKAPGALELCDGQDNDCDGLVDEDYHLELPCIVNDGCGTPGFTVCADDARKVVCWNDDSWCDQ